MALVLKFFVIEAYQIPSGSMQPTILGDSATGIKDRVLADKLITMIRDPQRWEVMIFRFPNDERRLYVKRIVGLPGETLQIRGGDVWIDDAIAAQARPRQRLGAQGRVPRLRRRHRAGSRLQRRTARGSR